MTTINLTGGPNGWFTFGAAPDEFGISNRASGVIGQFGVLHNQLYIFTDFTTDVWSNIPTFITVGAETREFPWKLNTSYNWDYGIADPFSLDIDFGMMTWLAKNRNGLVTFVASMGRQPQVISTEAVNVLLERGAEGEDLNAFLDNSAEGFLYQYENTIFY